MNISSGYLKKMWYLVFILIIIAFYGCKNQFDDKHLWSKRFGEDNWDMGQSVSVDSSGNIYGTGHFSSSDIDFGGCPLSSAGGYDIYLIKYAP